MKKVLSAVLAVLMIVSVCFITASADEEDFATVEALQFDRTPDIDGVVTVAEWGQPTVAHISYPDNPQTDIRDDDPTLEYTLWFRYTFDGFYIACQTPDTSPCNDNVSTNQVWNGDCLQLRLDPWGCTVDQGLFPAAARNANYSDDYQEFAFAYGTEDQQCYAYCWHGIMSGMALQSEGGKYSASNDGSTTTYEVFIPWDELLEEAPHVGTTYGIASALLTATQGENNNKYQNWLEWGSGVINGRDDNIYGTNRLVMSEKTVFGGAQLEDPNPVGEVTTKAPISDATGDFALIDVTKLSDANQIQHYKNEDGTVTFYFDEGVDPYISISISTQARVLAEDYPYFAIYLKTNNVDASGEMFFITSDSGISGYSAGYSTMFEYCDTEDFQVVVIDFSDCFDYAGYVGKLRFDAYDGGCSDPDEAEMTLYAAAFFKNYNDALYFRVEGMDVTLGEEYLAYAKELEEEENPAETKEQPPATATVTEPQAEATTEAPEATEAPAGTKAPESTKESGKPQQTGSNTWIIYVVIGVAAAAVAAVVVIIVLKKKK